MYRLHIYAVLDRALEYIISCKKGSEEIMCVYNNNNESIQTNDSINLTEMEANRVPTEYPVLVFIDFLHTHCGIYSPQINICC